MKLPEGMTRGTFEIATMHGLRAQKGYLVGPFAVHVGEGVWKFSHAETGMGIPRAFADTLSEAAALAKHLEAAIDWSRVKRGRKYPELVGWKKSMGKAVAAALDAWEARK